MKPALRREFSSFRDPAGFLFWQDGIVYRWVAPGYVPTLRAAERSGLIAKARDTHLLLDFETADATVVAPSAVPQGGEILKPRQLSLITYPYEWSFAQLQDAALATLDLHLLALEHGLLLKDASAFNMQFVDGRPTLIDHLSFDPIEAHSAWPAYGQFCRHFLAPLLLMSHVDLSLGRLLEIHLDGIPLDLAATLLPRRTRLSPSIQIHLHLHARMTRRFANERQRVETGRAALSASRHAAIAGSLRRLVAKLKPKQQITEWGDYYGDTNYSKSAFEEKKEIVRALVAKAAPQTLWDLGGNNGEMSRAVADLARDILCVDIDPLAVDHNYRRCRADRITNIVPALADLTNPPPARGFFNRERKALFERPAPDLAMALALIHHLAITNNLPLPYVAEFFAAVARHLVIEFVPKQDSQVRRLLANRPDIFPDYTQDGFERAFALHFETVDKRPIPETERTLYLMARRGSGEGFEVASA